MMTSLAIDGPEEQVCAQLLRVQGRAQGSRHTGVTAQASQETKQGLLQVYGDPREALSVLLSFAP